MGRLSLKKSRENLAHLAITKIPPYPTSFDKDSPTSVHILDDAAQRYYREVARMQSDPMSGGGGVGGVGGTGAGNRMDSKNDTINRNHEMKDYADDISRTRINDAEMCDMACQTR